jgi:hypothetical protein
MTTKISAATTWYPDRSTENAEVNTKVETVGEYLQSLGIYNPTKEAVEFGDGKVELSIQRAALKIEGNVVKEKMLEDVLRGALLPTISVHQRSNTRDVLDGLQRTHIFTKALETLIALRNHQPLEPYVKRIVDRLKDSPIAVEELLAQPVFLLIYRSLTETEVVRLFMLLNVGQQKVSDRHLLEILNQALERMFADWGLVTLTEKVEKTNGKSRAKWQEDDLLLPPYKLEYLVNCVRAYTNQDPQIKTKQEVQSVYKDGSKLSEIGPGLQQRLIDMGSEVSKSDFIWVFKELNDQIARIYIQKSKWRGVIHNSDNFTLPLIAALGKARDTTKSNPGLIEKHQQELLDELKAAEVDQDPLGFFAPEDRALGAMQDKVRSNIGRNQRNIVYKGWVEYFRKGSAYEGCLIDWAEAAVTT